MWDCGVEIYAKIKKKKAKTVLGFLSLSFHVESRVMTKDTSAHLYFLSYNSWGIQSIFLSHN